MTSALPQPADPIPRRSIEPGDEVDAALDALADDPENAQELAELAAWQAAIAVREQLGIDHADIALVLGSGWRDALDGVGEEIGRAALSDLPGFAAPVVEGHGGDLVAVRTASGSTAIVFTGRTHLYEGRGVARVVHGVHTAAALGVHTLVLTNAAGGLDPSWQPGTVVLISDHINLTGESALTGAQFVDMGHVYTPELRELAHEVDPDLPEGVYAQFRGPQYETPAEVRMAGAMGAGLVGMSTAVEATVARSEGLKVLALSLVTNAAAGVGEEPLAHGDVVAAAHDAVPRLAELLSGLLPRL